MSALQLGHDELVAVLRFLPQADCLGSCSLVSTQFRRAATAAATTSITVRARSLNSSSFQQLLEQHGHAVRGLEILPISTSSDWPHGLNVTMLQQLPNLSSLTLSNSTRVFSAFWCHVSDLTGLTQLSVHVNHTTTVNEFTSAMPRLQHLKRLSLTAPRAAISSSKPVHSAS
jgi:hypothetical protein